MLKTLPTLAIVWIAATSFAYAQTGSPAYRDGTKPGLDSPTFYAPYTGPGFGNPDANAREDKPVGKSRKKYQDAPGTSAYSRGGSTGATQLNPPQRKPKPKKKDGQDKAGESGAASTPASPPAAEKR